MAEHFEIHHNVEVGNCDAIKLVARMLIPKFFNSDITMQYLCLYYGTNNNQYRNFCEFQEDVTPVNPKDHLLSQRPPCRSFCVQVRYNTFSW